MLLLPEPEGANLYNEELASPLTRVIIRNRPFASEEEKATVERLFADTYPELVDLLNGTVNTNLLPFKDNDLSCKPN